MRENIMLLNKQDLKVKTITEVCIDKSFQKKGLGKILIKNASTYISNLVNPIGFLICDIRLKDFYLSCGWKKITNVKISKTLGERCYPIDPKQNIFFYDPKNVIRGNIIVSGNNF